MSVWIIMLEVFGRDRSAFDVQVCHPIADSYRDLTPKQIYKKREKEKKRLYAERVMETTLCDTMLERLKIQKATARLC